MMVLVTLTEFDSWTERPALWCGVVAWQTWGWSRVQVIREQGASYGRRARARFSSLT